MAVKRTPAQSPQVQHIGSGLTPDDSTGIAAFNLAGTNTTTPSNFIPCECAKTITVVIVKTGAGTGGASNVSISIQFFDDAGNAMTEAINLATAITVTSGNPLRIVAGINESGLFTSLGTIGASLIATSAYGGLLGFTKCKVSLTTGGTAGAGTADGALHVFIKR